MISFWLCSVWDLGSRIRDGPRASCTAGVESQSLARQGSPHHYQFQSTPLPPEKPCTLGSYHPQGRHQPAETCPRTAGTPRLLTAAPPVPAHRASSPKWDRPAVSPPRGLDQTVPEPQAPRDPPCPACSQGGHQPREGLPAPAPRLGGVTPRARGLLPGARMEPPERGDPVPSPQSPRRRSGPAGLPHGWKLPGSSGVCQKHELRWAYLERHSPRTGVHSTPSSVGGQAGWGQLQANPQTHTRRERLTQDGGQRGSRRRLESAHHPPPN